jgi:predicted porin
MLSFDGGMATSICFGIDSCSTTLSCIRFWFGGGMTVPVTPAGTMLVSFIDKHDVAGAGRDAKQWAVGYIYSLSKRTNLYTSYGYISNDRAGAFFVKDSSGGGSSDQVIGASSSAMTIGMRHRF